MDDRGVWGDRGKQTFVQRFAIAVLAPAVLAVACGGAPDGEAELTAEPYPRELEASPMQGDPDADEAESETPDRHEANAGDDGESTDDASPKSDALSGPRPADAAEYVQRHLPPNALDHDVLLVDEPPQAPQLLLAVVTDDRRGLLEVARWEGQDFERALRLDAGPAESLGTLRTPRVGEQRLVALGLRHDGELRIGVWSLGQARLTVPEACPLSEPREVRRQGAEVEVACDAAGGDEGRLVWDDGAFRAPKAASRGHVRAEPPQRPEAPERAERSQGQGPPEHAERPPRSQRDRPDAAGGRSDAAGNPPGTQGRGPRGR